MDAPQSATDRTGHTAPVLLTFGAAIFLSAALLFAVQPLFAKMVLPRLGGSPAVWSVAMVFFQAVLLLGYAYAHLLTRRAPLRLAVAIHIAVLIGASLTLPLAVAAGWGRPPAEGEVAWLLGLFAVSIGLPFFALSANGPLLQAWFARSDHPAAKDPYFLYAASNVGSFLALLSYPLLAEPFSRLGDQTRAWSLGYYVLIALIVGCGLLLLRSRSARAVAGAVGSPAEATPSWRQAAVWVALSAIPAALLIAVTAHVTTDVAAAPLLWVIPLALYLLSFVVVFQTRPAIPHDLMVRIQPLFIAALVAVLAFEVIHHIFLTMAVNLAAFFAIALVCHGELVRRRPPAQHLTAFYMWLSVGGMIGGIAAGLVAPRVFSWVAEYPLLIVLAILCRPGLAWPRGRREDWLWLAVVAAAAVVLVPGPLYGYAPDERILQAAIAGLVLLSLLLSREPLRFAAVVALIFAGVQIYAPGVASRDYVRSFFGVHKIVETADGQYRILMHGTTEHGAQRIRDEYGQPLTDRPEPLTYYHPASPMAQAILMLRARKSGPLRMAVVGLGTGTLACYAEPGDALHFYEIDPAVIRIARDPSRFTYLAKCAPDASIIVGDARLTLAEAADGYYDVIVVDAFSSDAIPIHLLTREAMAVYARKLAPQGLILMHISNRHMELASVVAGIAHANGLLTRVSEGETDQDDENYKFASTVAAVARDAADFGSLDDADEWEVEEPDAAQWVWTDDYSNIIGAMIRQFRR